jgi:hypothetical protein
VWTKGGRLTAVAIAAAAMSVAVAGCASSSSGSGSGGGSGSASLSSSASSSGTGGDIASLSATEIVARAAAALKAAKSVRVVGSGADSDGKQIQLNFGLTDTATAGTIGQDGVTIDIIVTGATAYFKAPDSYWQKELAGKANAAAILELVRGKWIKGPTTNPQFSGFADFTKASFVKQITTPTGTVTKAGAKQVDGVAAVGVTSEKSTLYVAAADARPLEIDPVAGATDSGRASFTDYDKVAEPTPPPADLTIDVTKLGG